MGEREALPQLPTCGAPPPPAPPPLRCRAMYLCTIHMTRMLLLVQGFMRIYRVSSLLKSDQSKVDEETHRTALQLQMNIQQHILAQSEAKLKESAKRIAQFLHAKVCVRVCVRALHVCILLLLPAPSQGPAIEVTEKMVESVTVLVWSAEANSTKRDMQPSAVHESVCKVTGQRYPTDQQPPQLV